MPRLNPLDAAPRDGKPAAGVQLAWEVMYDKKPEAQCWVPVGLHLVTKKILTATGSCAVRLVCQQGSAVAPLSAEAANL